MTRVPNREELEEDLQSVFVAIVGSFLRMLGLTFNQRTLDLGTDCY